MEKSRIIEICQKYLPTFKNAIKNIKYELKGITNSEMLLFISLVHYFRVKLIIESGRANGLSTKIIAENFKPPDFEFYSIENNKYSPDVKKSYEKLKNYRNIKLLFGDSNKLIPKLITEECCILIDGPKDDAAITLALECLKKPLVKAVFIHDLHKDSPHRKWVEKIFSNHFFTDDIDYIEKFKSLDKRVWIELRKYREYRAWKPYKRNKKKMKSYSATLSAIMNSNNCYDQKIYEEYLECLKNKKRAWKIKSLFENWPLRIKNIIQFPSFYIYYEKVIDRKVQLNFFNFLIEWAKRILSQILSIIVFRYYC